MTHKTNPKILRIESMKDWLSKGFYGLKMKDKLEQDIQIRKF